MRKIRQLYPTVTHRRGYFAFSKRSAPNAKSVDRCSNLREEKKSRIENPSSRESVEGIKGGSKVSTYEG
jgi:hypothetical protein